MLSYLWSGWLGSTAQPEDVNVTPMHQEAHRKRRCNVLAFVAAMAIILGLTGYFCFAQSDSESAASAVAAEHGHQQFESSCSFCHGPDATGARGPDLVRSKLVNDDVGGNLIGEVILDGRPDKGMPAFSMTKAQIADIAAFLHARVRAGIKSAGVSNNYPLSRLLTGNAEQGKMYFNGAGKCAACHSPTGDLAHIAGKYTPLELEVRMLSPRGATPTVTVTLPSGKTVKGKLEHIDEFNVALRDSAGWYQSFPRARVKVDVHDPLAAHHAMLSKLTQADVHNLFAYLETLK